MNKYISPEYKKEAFHCAHCQTYSRQKWGFWGRDIGGGYFYIK